jgi:hypothetical protein
MVLLLYTFAYNWTDGFAALFCSWSATVALPGLPGDSQTLPLSPAAHFHQVQGET